MRRGRIRRFWAYVKPFQGQVAVLFVIIAGSMLVQLPSPWLEKRIIDEAIPEASFALLTTLVVAVVALFAASRVLQFVRGYLSVRIQQKVLTSVRIAMYEHMQRMSLGFFARHASGNLLSRVTHDVQQVQNLVNDQMFTVIASSLKIAVSIGFLLVISPKLTLICGAPLPLIVLVFVLLRKKVYAQNVMLQERHADMSGRIQQSFSGMKVIQAEVIEDRMRDETLRASRQLERVGIRRAVLSHGGDLATSLLAYLPILVGIWLVGGKMVIAGTLTIGGLIAFTQYLFGIIGPATQIFRFNMDLQAGYAALDRIYAILDEEPEVCDAPGARALVQPIASIEFEHVWLTYGEPGDGEVHALRDVSFEVRRGHTVGLVGPSGAGKTSVLNLLLRFCEPTRGQIRINGEPIETFTIESIRRAMAYVSQEVFLFGASIRDNVTLGREVGDGEVDRALAVAAAQDFVHQLNGGVDAMVGERGLNLSGGQRQRLAVARMVLKHAPVFLLDEATASLDAESEHRVLEALRDHLRERTALIVAHRFSFLSLVDHVLVFAEGRLVEQGTPDALLHKQGLFHALHQAQQV